MIALDKRGAISYYRDMENTQIWTPKSVSRPAGGFAVLCIAANWKRRQDTLWFSVDGFVHEWHRRGARLFKTRAECAEHIAAQGWPRG